MVHRTSNGTLQVSQSIHPQDKSGKNIRHSRIPPQFLNMPQMSSMDATYHAAQDLINEIHHPEPTSTLLKLGDGHKEPLKQK